MQDGLATDLTLSDCDHQQELLPTVVGAVGGNSTVRAMDHGDLQPQNIIVDNKYNIVGYALESDKMFSTFCEHR